MASDILYRCSCEVRVRCMHVQQKFLITNEEYDLNFLFLGAAASS